MFRRIKYDVKNVGRFLMFQYMVNNEASAQLLGKVDVRVGPGNDFIAPSNATSSVNIFEE